MLDADVGRLLNAIESSGQADNTIIIFTSDHGEGGGSHGHVQKWTTYEESVKVPLILSCPARFKQKVCDDVHLVNGLDIMSTICDYACIKPPPDTQGKSLRPILEGDQVPWRQFVVTESIMYGRMVRSDRFKYVKFAYDPIEQLFDLKTDPWETKNLFYDYDNLLLLKLLDN